MKTITSKTTVRYIITSLLIFLACAGLSSCSSYSALTFAKQTWHLDSDSTKNMYVINGDSSMKFIVYKHKDGVGDVDIDKVKAMYTHDAFANNPWLEDNLAKICGRLGSLIKVDSVLFYSPLGSMVVVKCSSATATPPPAISTTNMGDTAMCRTWCYEDKWRVAPLTKRWKEDMYTYIYFKDRKNRFYVLNLLTYAGKDIGIIYIGESTSWVKNSKKIRRYPTGATFLRDMQNQTSRLYVIGTYAKDCIDNSIMNYRIGLRH